MEKSACSFQPETRELWPKIHTWEGEKEHARTPILSRWIDRSMKRVLFCHYNGRKCERKKSFSLQEKRSSMEENILRRRFFFFSTWKQNLFFQTLSKKGRRTPFFIYHLRSFLCVDSNLFPGALARKKVTQEDIGPAERKSWGGWLFTPKLRACVRACVRATKDTQRLSFFCIRTSFSF